MKKSILVIFSLLLVGSFILASLDAVNLANPKSLNEIKIPPHAVKISDDVYSLGAKKVNGKIVEGLMFVHHAKGKENSAKPSWAGGSKTGKSTCYAFLSKGAKWKTNENWIVNPSNSQNLDENSVFNNFALNIKKWEDASSYNIMGDGSSTNSILTADTSSPDGQNEIYFGSISEPGAIAVTIVWGIFSGPLQGRELVEWDQVYDEADFAWSLTGEAGKMDFENIATHEIGHAVGMGHPENACTEETMYAYAGYGETKKRDLNSGDIEGIMKLY